MQRLWKTGRRLQPVFGVAVISLFLLLPCGCEDDDSHDHNPPAGLGSLVIDNHTADDIDLFLNGAHVGEIRNDRIRFFDLEPGLYRMVLDDEDDSPRGYRADLDILEGRLTILDVYTDVDNFDRYTVAWEID